MDHVTASGGVLTVAAAAIIAHVAVHRVLDRGAALEQIGAFASQHALMLLALAWTVIMMLVAFAKFARGSAPGTDRAFDAVR
jgi:hypothetical protein